MMVFSSLWNQGVRKARVREAEAEGGPWPCCSAGSPVVCLRRTSGPAWRFREYVIDRDGGEYLNNGGGPISPRL